LEQIATTLCGPPRVILDRDGRTKYISRYYIRGAPYMTDGSSPYTPEGNPKKEAIFPKGVGVYIHRIHGSDGGEALHNHPWDWAVSLILAGGYSEERRRSIAGEEGLHGADVADQEIFLVDRLDYSPGDINILTGESFHRLDLKKSEAWTIFVVGDKRTTWFFWERLSRKLVQWREYLTRMRGREV
jgi:hypothetical protein